LEDALDNWTFWHPAGVGARGYTAAAPDSPSRHSGRAAGAIPDEELMRRYQRGDEAAFRQLYERYRAPLRRFVRQSALNTADIDEVTQETWLAVIHGRERYQPQARFVTYLFSIARRRGMDRWRRRGRQPQEHGVEMELLPAPPHEQPEPFLGAEALGEAIAKAVAALPLLQRETFLLRSDTDLNLEEIAQVTGTSRETAKSRLRYAQERLRIALERWQ
jgi:RNA polymerase sigma-70 factor (ECF subfamily)